MDFISNKLTKIKKTLITSWNFKTTIVWGTISTVFIIIDIIYFLIAIGFRNTDCINDSNYDLPEWILMTTGLSLGMILASWMFNYIGSQGFWLSLLNFAFHVIFVGWLVLSSIIGILLITFSDDDCTDKPEALFVLSLLYLLVHNMIGSLLMTVYCGALMLNSCNQYHNRYHLLDDLIV